MPIANKTQKFDAVLITACGYESWPGSFIARLTPSFSTKQCANPASKTLVSEFTGTNKHTWETPLLPQKNKLHPLFTQCWVLWEAEQGNLSLNQKHTSLETFFTSKSCAWEIVLEKIVSTPNLMTCTVSSTTNVSFININISVKIYQFFKCKVFKCFKTLPVSMTIASMANDHEAILVIPLWTWNTIYNTSWSGSRCTDACVN